VIRQRAGLIDATLEQRARRTAKRIGLRATKSRWRAGTVDNRGRFMLIDPHRNLVVAGERFNMTAQEVIERCTKG
jgi:hypothetical protein